MHLVRGFFLLISLFPPMSVITKWESIASKFTSKIIKNEYFDLNPKRWLKYTTIVFESLWMNEKVVMEIALSKSSL